MASKFDMPAGNSVLGGKSKGDKGAAVAGE